MENDPLFSGERIYELIPQRPPIVMVDALYRYDREGAETGLDVLTDNIFVEDGKFTAPGLIEHVAQSAAVFAGYGAFVRGLTPETGQTRGFVNIGSNQVRAWENPIAKSLHSLRHSQRILAGRNHHRIRNHIQHRMRRKPVGNSLHYLDSSGHPYLDVPE